MGSNDHMGQKYLYQQASQPAKGSRLGMMRKAAGDLQSIEAEVVRVHKQKMQGDVDTSSLIINETGLTCGHLRYMHTNKEVQCRPKRSIWQIHTHFQGNQQNWVSI